MLLKRSMINFERIKNIFDQLNDKLKNEKIILFLLTIYHILLDSFIYPLLDYYSEIINIYVNIVIQ